MFLSDVSVRRPVLAVVLSLLLVVLGVMSFLRLPLREFRFHCPPEPAFLTVTRSVVLQPSDRFPDAVCRE